MRLGSRLAPKRVKIPHRFTAKSPVSDAHSQTQCGETRPGGEIRTRAHQQATPLPGSGTSPPFVRRRWSGSARLVQVCGRCIATTDGLTAVATQMPTNTATRPTTRFQRTGSSSSNAPTNAAVIGLTVTEIATRVGVVRLSANAQKIESDGCAEQAEIDHGQPLRLTKRGNRRKAAARPRHDNETERANAHSHGRERDWARTPDERLRPDTVKGHAKRGRDHQHIAPPGTLRREGHLRLRPRRAAQLSLPPSNAALK